MAEKGLYYYCGDELLDLRAQVSEHMSGSVNADNARDLLTIHRFLDALLKVDTSTLLYPLTEVWEAPVSVELPTGPRLVLKLRKSPVPGGAGNFAFPDE